MTGNQRKKSGKKKKKKIQYRKVVLKLTAVQKRTVERYCAYHGTTLKKLIKLAVKDYIENHGGEIMEDEPVSKNQLQLFDPEDYYMKGRQMDLFNKT